MKPAPPAKARRVPSICQPGFENFSRFNDCYDAGWILTIINVQTGQVVGTVTGETTLWNTLSYKSRSWNENIEVEVAGVTGEGAGTTFTAPIGCLGLNPLVGTLCESTGSGSWRGQSGFLAAGVGDVYDGELGWASPFTSTMEFAFEVSMTFDNPVAGTSNPVIIGPTEAIRCDSHSYFKPTNGGCVYANATLNVLELSKSDTTITEAANFMAGAQKSIPNHVGEFSGSAPVGPAMTRTTDASRIRANRRVACKGLKVGKGQSCDEYPFASTSQGASLVPPGDFRRAAVNAKQNSKVGSYLSRFFLLLRIAGRDSFYLEIVS